ncbi:MAG: aminocarboxymuconate-semialdehyde decarboxylase [Candidatus Poriferisodalaceae bacterium]
MTVVVDIHAHHFPEGLPDLAATTGDNRWPSLVVGDEPRFMRGSELFRKVRPVAYDAVERVAELDAAGVDHQVISPVPVTLVDWAPAALAAEFLAAQNDGLAAAAAGSNGRLLALGALPLQDVDLAIAEMSRCRQMGMVGIEITAMVDGRELDDPSFLPFWEVAESEGVPIFIHPAHQATTIRRTGQPYEFGIGMHTDTALAAAALVYGGVLDRHPDLRVALSHGCGSFAWTHPRLRYMAARMSKNADEGARLDALVKHLWVDALVFDPGVIDVLVQRFGADHVMYGTDHPFLPEGFEGPRAVLVEALESGSTGSSALHDGCMGANAMKFLGLDS